MPIYDRVSGRDYVKYVLENQGAKNKQYDSNLDGMIEFDAMPTLVKEEMVRYGLNIMALKAMAQAETKDFYSMVADYNNYKETLYGIKGFDNNGGGVWVRNIRIAFDSAATEHAQYKVVIDANNIYVYSVDGTLKGQTRVGGFWDGVKSDGSDIRVANQDLTTPTQRYFWIDEFDYANKQAVIWVRVEDGDAELNITYGNPSATMSSYNNPNQVFEFYYAFNFFEGWTTWGTINTEILDGVLHIHGVNAGDAGFYRTDYQFSNFILETREKISSREPASPAIRLTDNNNMYFFAWFWGGNRENIRITKRVSGTVKHLTGDTPISAEYNVWRNIRIIANGTNLKMEVYTDGWKSLVGSISASDTEFSSGGIGFRTVGDSSNPSEGYIDWVRVLKLADPVDISSFNEISETINFDFPDGIDKVLVTVDGDISQIEYSTDGGTTWNVIQPDTETLLPTTANQIKFKFTGGLKCYAFLVW